MRVLTPTALETLPANGSSVRALYVVSIATLGALFAPESALAHVAGIEYRFPLPVAVYALAGGLAVLASAPAALFAVRDVHPWKGRARRPGEALDSLAELGTVALGLLLVVALVSGFFSSALGFNNAVNVLFWVDLWVGVGIVSALLGNLWDFVSPLNALGRLIDRLLSGRGVSARAYPDGLGVWPAVALVLGFSWIELVWPASRDPQTITLLISLYLLAQLVAMAVFGAEIWIGRGELFTVLARTFARLAPLEFAVDEAEFDCPARRCTGSERVGCSACWRVAPPEQRTVRLRSFGAGITREPQLGAGGAALVIALLGTVVYDGLRGTAAYGRLQGDLIDLLPSLANSYSALHSVLMTAVLSVFVLLYLAVCALISTLGPGGVIEAAGRYAPTLIPIAAVYFAAHYLLYLFYVGQLTPLVALDPFAQGWFPEYRPWTKVPGSVVWALQAGLIVFGHVVAVVQAHRVGLGQYANRRQALIAQLPLVGLMVAYTLIGLWVLGQALSP